MENFELIQEVSKLMTYESHEEKKSTSAERRIERNEMREREAKPHCSSWNRSCMEATNLPPWWLAQRFTVGVAESNSE